MAGFDTKQIYKKAWESHEKVHAFNQLANITLWELTFNEQKQILRLALTFTSLHGAL